MKEEEIEKEVQARVAFKMNELLDGVKNRVGWKYKQAFDMTPKSQYIWQAWQELAEIVRKEVEMATPRNNMHNHKKWEAKEIAVNEIMESILTTFRGYNSNGRDRIVNHVVRAVEKAQNF